MEFSELLDIINHCSGRTTKIIKEISSFDSGSVLIVTSSKSMSEQILEKIEYIVKPGVKVLVKTTMEINNNPNSLIGLRFDKIYFDVPEYTIFTLGEKFHKFIAQLSVTYPSKQYIR